MRAFLKPILFWPYQIYFWLVYVPILAVATLFFASLSVVLAVIFNARVGSRYGASVWARLMAWLLPMLVRVEGAENANRKNSYVIVSNHESQTDILALYGFLDLDMKWVIKQELRKVPGIGFGCAKLGHIFVDRRNVDKARAAINNALHQLGGGIGILFFPEGTRNLDGRMLPFKKGAFRVAIDQQMPVLPITLIGTRDILAAKTLRPFPGLVRMKIHPPINTEGLELSDLRELMSQARRAIESGQANVSTTGIDDAAETA